MGRDTIQLENAVSTISQEYLLEFTSKYGIPESLHPELPGPADPIVEFPEGKVGVYTKFFEFANFHMDLFSLISAPNPTKMKTETHPCAAHEVPLLTVTANRVIDMEDMTGASGSSGTPSTGISPVGNPPYTEVAPEPGLEKETVAMGSLVNKRRRKRGPDETEANAPPKVLRKDHVASHLSQKTPVHAEGVSDQDPLSYAKPPSAPEQDIAQSSRNAVVTEDPDSEKSDSFTSMDMMDHIVPPGYFSELRHLPNDEFLNQYNTTMARQVAMGSQLREKHIKNLKALLEAEADMKDIVEAKNVELVKELESLRAQVTGEERIKAAFEEFKKYENDRELYPRMLTAIAGRRWVIGNGLRLAIMKCVESTELRHVFADVVSAGIAKGMSEGLKHGVKHGKDKVDLAAIEAYDHEADTKYVAALHALKDLKYPLEILLEDAIAANISRAEKKKKCQVVCRTHGVGSAHHVRSDGIPVSVPTVAPQGLAIVLAYAARQTDITEDEASPKLLRSKSLPPMYNLDWP
nr:hypothetical protein [Tanacetum cinerariifolium]